MNEDAFEYTFSKKDSIIVAMLKSLSITNLAIIENIDVTFKEGFTVLTGATGAGKSLLIDSLSLLLGARASNELIRAGEDKAMIKGLFEVSNPRIDALLSNLNIPMNGGSILIERTISRTKNVIKINGVPSSLADLSSLAKLLADIHNQFDFEKILNPENYLEIIDGFSYELTSSYKNDYASMLQDYKNKKNAYLAIVDKKNKLEESRDFYEYQYHELQEASLEDGEEDKISSEVSLLKNYDAIYSLSQEANQIIDEGFLDHLYDLNKILAKLSVYQKEYQQIHDTLDDRYYEIDDLLSTLKKDFEKMDYDPNRLNELEQRDSDLSSLKRKYKKTIPELIAYRDELGKLVGKDSNIDEEMNAAKRAMDDSFKALFVKGQELSTIRKRIAKTIEKELTKNLTDLLLRAVFQISFNEPKETDGDSILSDNGLDQVDFLIETNIGEGLKSLSKIVSGGEASRIMLAFKAIFIRANKIQTVIFDEIDTGLSGEAAQAVARKIHDISLLSQVIAITHMPQVASLSDHAILITKEVKQGRTFTHVKELSLDEKIEQVAGLISGGKVTEKQLEYAREMVLTKGA